MKNMEKDVPRGTSRLAEGASLLQEGRDVSDHSHVSRATPWDSKRKEIAEGLQYEAINKEREKRTTRLRRDKEVKPV